MFNFSKKTIAGLVAVYLLIGANVAMAARVFYYTPQNITNIAGRAFADSNCPTHLLNMSTSGMGANAVSTSITGWNLGSFTGVTSPSPYGNYQKGNLASSYGSLGVQMTGIQYGAHVHTYSIPGGSGYNYDLANAQVKYKWDLNDNIRPWANSIISNFQCEFDIKVPNSYMTGGAVGYVYLSILIKDSTLGPNDGWIYIQPQIYDTRWAPNQEYIGWDAGTNTVFANTFYDYYNSTQYGTKLPSSPPSRGYTWSNWERFGFSISRAQLTKIIDDINSQYSLGLSNNPSHYKLELFTVQNEIYWPTGNGHLSMGIRDIWVYSEYF